MATVNIMMGEAEGRRECIFVEVTWINRVPNFYALEGLVASYYIYNTCTYIFIIWCGTAYMTRSCVLESTIHLFTLQLWGDRLADHSMEQPLDSVLEGHGLIWGRYREVSKTVCNLTMDAGIEKPGFVIVVITAFEVSSLIGPLNGQSFKLST